MMTENLAKMLRDDMGYTIHCCIEKRVSLHLCFKMLLSNAKRVGIDPLELRRMVTLVYEASGYNAFTSAWPSTYQCAVCYRYDPACPVFHDRL